tara:strand:- start:2058 stop:2735 length:678 start_codon:yes stop_codon:yes gene_type:complete
MADSDYTVAVVLQASDEGMSSTIKKTSDNIEELGDDAKQAQLDLMATVVALEGLTSGLNQVTGGARKFTSALAQLDNVDKERVETINSHISKLELITGPMEFVIALQKIHTIASSSETVARLGEIKVKESLIIVNNSLVASMMVWAIVIIAVIAFLFLLYKVIFDTEEVMEKLADGVDRAKGAMAGMVQFSRELSHSLQEMASGAVEAIEPLTRVIGIIPGLGGD